jgi:hypothetical protein
VTHDWAEQRRYGLEAMARSRAVLTIPERKKNTTALFSALSA